MTKQRRFTKEFEDEAIRLAATSGRSQREIAEDPGIGPSTPARWGSRNRDRLAESPGKAPQADLAAEVKRLRRENEILRQERDILKRATAFFRPGGKSARFRLSDRAKQGFLVHRLCRAPGVSQGGYFSRKDRPASRRQRDDMVMLAHVRSAFALSNGAYGSAMDCDALRDDQWERIQSFVPGGTKGKRGPRTNNRRFLDALLWMARL